MNTHCLYHENYSYNFCFVFWQAQVLNNLTLVSTLHKVILPQTHKVKLSVNKVTSVTFQTDKVEKLLCK